VLFSALMTSLFAKSYFMTFSVARLHGFLPQTSTGVWWIALSGGLDSCVLLHSIAAAQLPVKLHALHINHQISPNADAWEQHCADLCAQLNVPFTAVKVDVKNTGRGVEDAAREARYAVFERHLVAGDYLLTAHHADDQSETMLLRLMRGTGPRGLAAIAQQRALAGGTLYRPLLSFTRTELEGYAQIQGLRWVNDESNSNDHYDRNYLRNQVMPVLRERWPAFANKWQQTADLCAANEALIEELAAQDALLADLKTAIVGTSISLLYFVSLSLSRRHNLIRSWLRGKGLSIPEQQHLKQIEQQIIAGRQDAETQVAWGNVSLRVYRQRVYALPLGDLPCPPDTASAFAFITELPAGFRFTLERVDSYSRLLLKADLPNLHLRFRQGGERCRPVGRAHSQTLKRLLQDYGVEPWLRDSLPLVYSDDHLVAVANLWICEGYQAEVDGYCLKYERIPKTLSANGSFSLSQESLSGRLAPRPER
jgi:tRNA(Ile)-lysidine synthase